MLNKKREPCQARTKSGDRCKRPAAKGAFCHQHGKLLNECLWAHPAGKLNYVPDPPPVLADTGSGYWTQFCSYLVEKDQLEGVHLGDLCELCWRIDFRDEIVELIEKYGLLNIYDKGPQLVGIDKILDRNDERMSRLKKMYGFTLDSQIKKQQKDSEKPGIKDFKDNIKPLRSAKPQGL